MLRMSEIRNSDPRQGEFLDQFPFRVEQGDSHIHQFHTLEKGEGKHFHVEIDPQELKHVIGLHGVKREVTIRMKQICGESMAGENDQQKADLRYFKLQTVKIAMALRDAEGKEL